MRKRYYKILSEAGELQGVTKSSSGVGGRIYSITETEYQLSLYALSLAAGVVPNTN